MEIRKNTENEVKIRELIRKLPGERQAIVQDFPVNDSELNRAEQINNIKILWQGTRRIIKTELKKNNINRIKLNIKK